MGKGDKNRKKGKTQEGENELGREIGNNSSTGNSGQLSYLCLK